MNEYGVVTEPGTVRLERVLPGPIERVWAYLTESDKRGKWLALGDMDLRVGGRTELTFHSSDLSPNREPTPDRFKQYENFSFQGRITRCEPPRVLSHTWGEHSEVTFELTPRGADVVMVLTHRKLAGRGEMLSVSSGWHTHVGILIDILNDRTPPGFWSTYAQVEAEYEKRIRAD
jgi:uncharacterized protein YndB with AHSA1/START domain